MKNKFRSTHNLKFQTTPFIAGEVGSSLQKFICGTCNGIWDTNPFFIDIIKVENSEPYNGQMRDVFEWIIETARIANLPIRIRNVKGQAFRQKLLDNWQFVETPNPEVLIRHEHCK